MQAPSSITFLSIYMSHITICSACYTNNHPPSWEGVQNQISRAETSKATFAFQINRERKETKSRDQPGRRIRISMGFMHIRSLHRERGGGLYETEDVREVEWISHLLNTDRGTNQKFFADIICGGSRPTRLVRNSYVQWCHIIIPHYQNQLTKNLWWSLRWCVDSWEKITCTGQKKYILRRLSPFCWPIWLIFVKLSSIQAKTCQAKKSAVIQFFPFSERHLEHEHGTVTWIQRRDNASHKSHPILIPFSHDNGTRWKWGKSSFTTSFVSSIPSRASLYDLHTGGGASMKIPESVWVCIISCSIISMSAQPYGLWPRSSTAMAATQLRR